MQTTLLGSTGDSSRTDGSGCRSPVKVKGANGCPSIGATTRSAGSVPGPSTTPKETAPSREKRAMGTCGLPPGDDLAEATGARLAIMAPERGLRVHLLGGLEVEGVPALSIGSRKARALLR